MDRLENTTAIITGAAHGIGSAIAELFAEQGAWVLATDIDAEAGEAVARRITSSGGRCQFAVADVRSEKDIAHAVETARGPVPDDSHRHPPDTSPEGR